MTARERKVRGLVRLVLARRGEGGAALQLAREIEALDKPFIDPGAPLPAKVFNPGPHCGETTECGGTCALAPGHANDHVCQPDENTGEETCQA